MILLLIILLLIVLTVFVVSRYNGLVKLRNLVDNAWAQIDVQLKRRADLIPNLIETVKGYASHERETFEAVVEARSALVKADGSPQEQAEADNMLSGALKSLFAVAEAYPDLKANQSFLALQSELTVTEDKIAYSRQYYNDSVNKINTKIESFPDMFFAGMAKATHREYFLTPDEATREVPEVSF